MRFTYKLNEKTPPSWPNRGKILWKRNSIVILWTPDIPGTEGNPKWSYVFRGFYLCWVNLEAVFVEFISKTRHLRSRTSVEKYFNTSTVSEVTRFTNKLNENRLQVNPTEVKSSENVTPFWISFSPGDVRGS